MSRIGSFVFATTQGLGILAKDFYDHGVITDVMVITHGSRPNHPEWYPDSFVVKNPKSATDKAAMYEFAHSMDTMFFLETPFNWDIIPYCRKHAVKTALMPMYECEPNPLPCLPDLFICPSMLDRQVFNYPSDSGNPRSTFIPVPVNVPWKQRQTARTFVHNAGHGGLKGRNGTAELIESLQHLNSDAKIIIRSQDDDIQTSDRAEIRVGTYPYETLYEEGDVFVFPETFNGLSLPLQEARAAGMLVMSAARFPMTTWLPKEPLIPVQGYRRDRIGGCTPFDRAIVDPKDIAATIDSWYDKDISNYSLSGKEWAEQNSWEVLKPKYMGLLAS